jgi:hypothetical protein
MRRFDSDPRLQSFLIPCESALVLAALEHPILTQSSAARKTAGALPS